MKALFPAFKSVEKGESESKKFLRRPNPTVVARDEDDRVWWCSGKTSHLFGCVHNEEGSLSIRKRKKRG